MVDDGVVAAGGCVGIAALTAGKGASTSACVGNPLKSSKLNQSTGRRL